MSKPPTHLRPGRYYSEVELSDLLYSTLIKRGITQKEAACSLGVSTPALHQAVNYRTHPTTGYAIRRRLAFHLFALDVSPAEYSLCRG